MIKIIKKMNLGPITKYTLGTMLLSVTLLQKFPFIKVPGTFVAIRIEDFVMLFAGMLALLYYLKDPKSFFKNNFYRLYCLYLVVAFISLINGIFILKTVTPNLGILHFIRRIEYFVPFVLAYELVKNKAINYSYFYKIFVVIIFLVFLYGFGQKYFGVPVIVTQNQEYSQGVALKFVEGSHLNSTFAGHYDLATFLVMLLPVFVIAFFSSMSLSGRMFKLQALLIFIFGMWLIVNSASRISIVSLLVAESAALFIANKKRYIPVVVIFSILFIGMSSNLLNRYSRFVNVYSERVKTLFSYSINIAHAAEEDTFKRINEFPTPTATQVFEDRSTSIRVNVEWPRALRSLAKNPLLGTGFSSIDLATDNDYLRFLGETGFLGFYVFSLFWIQVISVFIKNLKKLTINDDIIKNSLLLGFFGSIPGIFINATFIDIFEASKFAIILWFICGLSLSSLVNTKKS